MLTILFIFAFPHTCFSLRKKDPKVYFFSYLFKHILAQWEVVKFFNCHAPVQTFVPHNFIKIKTKCMTHKQKFLFAHNPQNIINVY